MKRTIFNTLLFVTGAAFGSVVTWKFVETKYARIAQEEIDSVKEAFARDQKGDNESDTSSKVEEMEDPDEPDPKDYDEYVEAVRTLGYNHEEGGAMMGDKPYVIHPTEFGEKDDYGTETLMYFADKILTDDMDHPIEDVEAMVGVESLTHFGEYEEDSVHVRNDRLKIDFEILRDERRFVDIKKHHYRLVGENDA